MGKNVLLCNGGGPTAVINLTNMGIVEGCLDFGLGERRIYTALGGTGALIGQHATGDGQRHIGRLDNYLADHTLRQHVKNTPSTWIGSGRYKLGSKVPADISGGDKEKATDYDISRIIAVCDELDIGHVFFVGGDDTLTTLNALASYAERNPRSEWPTFLSVPKTIDCDLPYAVDDPGHDPYHPGIIRRNGQIMVCDTCPGFGTAANFIAAEVAHLGVEARALSRHYVIEIMGRDAGFLTAAALAAAGCGYGPHMIALPEHGRFDIPSFCRLIAERDEREGWGVYCVSEGIRNADGVPLASTGIDSFGNQKLGGAGERLKDEANSYCSCEGLEADLRYIKPGEFQRTCSYHRSQADAEIAYKVGQKAAFWAIVRGETGKLVTIVRTTEGVPSWHYGLVDTHLVAGKDKKREMSAEWCSSYDYQGLTVPYVADSFLTWLTPLIDPIVPIAGPYSGEVIRL
ncbi:MAG: 6-phosphofructokinase [Fimbriimonadaceae bacterium]|nr:6-phosphofructokinase [Fimbriimonadaceae bacterium]